MAYQRNGYYYRSRRDGDRVVTEYLGRAEWATAAAELDAFERERRREEAAEERARRETELQLDRDIDALGEIARAVTTAALLASGYHTHRRQWRRQRRERTDNRTTDDPAAEAAGAGSLQC